MPKVVVVEKALDVVNNLFKWFSADERRKRRKLQYDDRINKAIDLEEKHYDRLQSFITFLNKRLLPVIKEKGEKKYYKDEVARFRNDSKKFKELT